MDNSTTKKPGGPSDTTPHGSAGGKPYSDRRPASQGVKPYGDRKPASQGAKTSSRPYGDKPAPRPYGDKPAPRPYGDKPAPRPYGDKPAPRPYGDKPAPRPYGDKRSYSENKPYSERKSFSENKPDSEKKPFSESKPFSDRKPYSDKKPYSQSKPYSERSKFSDHKPYPRPAPAPRITQKEEEAAVTEQQLQVLVSTIATEPVTSLSALAAHAKKRAARETLEHIFSDRATLYAALSAPEPKARKNAARLLGAFANERDTDTLIAALQSEETRFVIPSILLALGAIAGTKAGEAIKAYLPPQAADETEEKHVSDI